jgi:hypothetical protein
MIATGSENFLSPEKRDGGWFQNCVAEICVD